MIILMSFITIFYFMPKVLFCFNFLKVIQALLNYINEFLYIHLLLFLIIY